MPPSDASWAQAPRPTLLSSCALATTAAEARFRISYPDQSARQSRVIAADEQAAVLVRSVAADRTWRGGHFLAFDRIASGNDPLASGNGLDGAPADAVLRAPDGTETMLSAELKGADLAVIVATAAAREQTASVIGDACAERMVMSAGLIIAQQGEADAVVSALRPNAMVLIVLRNGDDIPEILSALRV